MRYNKKVLVLLDGGAHCREAINRAALLADSTGTELQLMWFGKRPAWQGLEDEITQLNQKYSTVSQVATGHLLKEIQSLWQTDHFALLIKGCDLKHGGLSLMAPIDWQLLRETPCPVLLVKSATPWIDRPILAAINPLSTKVHQVLHDQNVLQLASSIANKAQSPMHTAIATPPPMMAADTVAQVPGLIEQKARKAAMDMFSELEVYPEQIHLGEGPAEFYIPQVSKQHDVGLVVISTRARGGLSAVLLGNTAEQMLDRLRCDVLVLRPGVSGKLPFV